MKEIRNMDELITIAGLFKAGEVTPYAFDRELAEALEELTYPIPVIVKSVGTAEDDSKEAFIVATMPNVSTKRSSATIYVSTALVQALSVEDMLKVVTLEATNIQSSFRLYSKFMSSAADVMTTVSECLAVLIELYENSLQNLKDNLPEIFEELKEKNLAVEPSDLAEQRIALADGEMKFSELVEVLAVKYFFPKPLITKARETAELLMTGGASGADADVESNPHEPSINTHDRRIKELTDDTYKNMSKVIEHDWQPDSNQ